MSIIKIVTFLYIKLIYLHLEEQLDFEILNKVDEYLNKRFRDIYSNAMR